MITRQADLMGVTPILSMGTVPFCLPTVLPFYPLARWLVSWLSPGRSEFWAPVKSRALRERCRDRSICRKNQLFCAGRGQNNRLSFLRLVRCGMGRIPRKEAQVYPWDEHAIPQALDPHSTGRSMWNLMRIMCTHRELQPSRADQETGKPPQGGCPHSCPMRGALKDWEDEGAS